MNALLQEIEQDSALFRECLAQEDWSTALSIAKQRDEKIAYVFERLEAFDPTEVRAIMETILMENKIQTDSLSQKKTTLASNVIHIRDTFAQLQQYSQIENS